MQHEEPISIPCKLCSRPVEIIPTLANLANDHGTYCDACLQRVNTQRDTEHRKTCTASRFGLLCPPCFDDTEIGRLPCQARSGWALGWKFGSKGLNLWGHPGTGKTRTMSLILEREALAGRSIVALGPGDFRAHCEARDYRRAPWLRRLALADLLFIDDFDKQNLTRGMEKDLFGVLNARMGRRPVMTTGNTPGAALEKQFSLGGPMVDRIRRYCVNVHFGREDVGA